MTGRQEGSKTLQLACTPKHLPKVLVVRAHAEASTRRSTEIAAALDLAGEGRGVPGGEWVPQQAAGWTAHR